MAAPMGMWSSRPGPCTHNPANAALVRLRKDIAADPSGNVDRHVNRMFDFLWRMSSSYSYSVYGYYENHHAFRVCYRWLKIYGRYS